MRSEEEIKKLILDFAEADNRVRAVLLNGSRANPLAKADKYQDFDIVFIVDRMETFTNDHSWTSVFGKQIIRQLPDAMHLPGDNYTISSTSFGYLMLLEDKNRIDLTLFPVEKTRTEFVPESLTLVWLDKDSLFAKLPPPSDSDYHVQKPDETQFTDTCNEFWWVSTYVAKGLLRNEIIYAKAMLDTVGRPMFLQVIEWKAGCDYNFSIATGKAGRFLQQYLPDDLYQKILLTYSNFETAATWKALLVMAEIFQQLSHSVAAELGFSIDTTAEQNTLAYLNEMMGKQ